MSQHARAFVALLSILALVGATGTASASAAAPGGSRCTIVGTSGDDVLRGTPGDDVICGYGGDDRLLGLAGDDVLIGGRGDDVLLGGVGDDVIAGRLGDDVVRGEDGDDRLTGGRGADHLVGGPGRDLLAGGRENDRLDGRDGSAAVDSIGCGPGRDTAAGDPADRVRGTCERVSQADAPVAVRLAPAAVAENRPAGTSVGQLVVRDPDRGERHSLALVPGPGSADGPAFAVAGTTLITTRPLDHETEATVEVRVRATDPAGLSVEQALTVTVTDEDEPALAADDAATVAEDSPVARIDVLANDRDAEGQPFAVTAVTQPAGGTVLVTDDRAGLTYRPADDRCTPPGSPDTFTYTITGGSTATVAVTVTCFPDAPVLTTSPGATAYDEGDTATPADPGLLLTDVDPDPRITRATVSVTTGLVAAEDVLALGGSHPGITASWAAGTLTLTGSAPVAAYQAALRDVSYENTSDASASPRRTLTFAVAGDDGHDATATKVLDVTPVNDAPVLAPATGSVAHTEGGAASPVADTITVTDPDDTALLSASVRITEDRQAGDVLAAVDSASVGVAYDAATGVLDLLPTGASSTPAQLQAVLRTVTFATSEDDPTTRRTLEIVVTDGEGPSAPAIRTVTVVPTNDAPAVVVSTGAVTVSEDDADGEVVDPAVTVSDVDDAQLTGAVVTLVGGEDGDELTVDDQGAVTAAAYDAAAGTLTLSGTASLGQYREVLRTVRLVVGGQDPSASARTVRFTVTDGDDATSSNGRSVGVQPVNDAPVVVLPGPQVVDEDAILTLDGPSAISVDDPDARDGELRVTLSATRGTVTLGATSGLTFAVGDGTADATTTFDATLAQVRAALAGTTFVPEAGYSGPASIEVSTSDRGNTGAGGARSDTGSVAIAVAAVNDAPVITAPATAVLHQSGSRTFSVSGGNAITIDDVDAGTGDVRVRLGVGDGTLTLAGTTGLTFTTGDGTDDAALDLTGPLTAVDAALDGLRYEPRAGWFGADTLDIAVDDLGNTGTGGARTAEHAVSLDVLETNSAPVNTVPGPQTVAEDGTLTFAAATTLAVADDDVDAATGSLEVDLDVDHGLLTLDGTAGLTFSTGDGADDARLTFRGTPDAINAALDGATYGPDPDYAGADTLTVVTDDLGEAGPPGALTDTDTVGLTVTAVNDAPVVTGPSSLTVAEDTASSALGVGVADVDAGDDDLEISLAVGSGTLTLATTSGLTFTTGDGTADAEIVARGSVADLDAALATLSYRGGADYAGADALTVTASDLGHQGAGGAMTASETVDITVTAVNDAPVNTVPAQQVVDEDTTLVLTGADAISVADVDAGDAPLRVTLSASGTRLTLATTAGVTFVSGDGTSDAMMTFTGPATAVNTALDGLALTPDADSTGSAGLVVSTNDQGSTGSGGPQSDLDLVDVSITAVNDAPVLGQPDTAALSYAEDVPSEDHADPVAPQLTVADVDSANLAGATVVIGNHAAGDELVFVNQNGIVGSFGSGTLTLIGSASVATYQAALRSVRYRTTSEAPAETQRTVTFRVDDGRAANNLSGQVARVVDVVGTNDAPSADDETFSGARRAVGNTSLVVDDPSDAAPDPVGVQKTVSGDILAGDTDPESAASTLSVTPVANAATTAGGSITVEADGDFTYLPPQGCGTATDTYDYTVNDNAPTGNLADTGTLTISIADCVWYVDSRVASQPATAVGGTSQLPYKTLADLDGGSDEDGPGDVLFIFSNTTYAGPLPLEPSQQLLTQAHGLSVPDGASGSVVLSAPQGSNPTVSGVVASTDNTIQGLTLGASSGFSLSGSSVGTLTINTVTPGGLFNAVGGAVRIDGTGNTLDVRLSSLTAAGGSNANGIGLSNASGTFVAGPGTLSGGSGTEVALTDSPLDFRLDANVNNTAGQLVTVAGSGGGTKDFNGRLVSSASGIGLTNNGGTTIRFDGGLALTTSTNAGFSATGGGTVVVSDPASTNNTIDTTTGTPLSVASTTIGADGLTFERISSTGAVNGISLVSTGDVGGLTVTGNGGACTTVTPTCTGGTIQGASGPGVRAEGVGGGVSLTHVRVNGGTGDGIRFAESAGLAVTSSLVTGNGDATTSDGTAAGRDRGIDVENGTGSIAVVLSEVSASQTDNIRLDNDGGSVDLDLTTSTVAGAKQGDGVQVYGDGTATVKADVTGSTFATNYDDAFQLVTTAAPTMDLNLVSNQLSADATQVSAGALVTISPAGTSTTRVDVAGNMLAGSKGSAMILNPAGSSQFDGTIRSNTIQGAGGIGIWAKPAQAAQSRMRIATNTVTGSQGQGMYLRHGEGIGGRADFVVQGNTVSSAVGQEAVFVESGTTSSGSEAVTVCADIGGSGALANGLSGGSGFDDVAFARYTGSGLVLPGYPGGSDPTAYVAARNTGNPVVSNWGPQDPTGGPACQTPSLPPAP